MNKLNDYKGSFRQLSHMTTIFGKNWCHVPKFKWVQKWIQGKDFGYGDRNYYLSSWS